MSERPLQAQPHPPPEELNGSHKLFQILTRTTSSHSDFNEFVAPMTNMVISNSYTAHLMAPYEREHWWIPMDHCYARPWNWRPESTFLRPTKTLFMPKTTINKRKSTNPLAPIQEVDGVVDVVGDAEKPAIIYDKSKAKHLMEECERHAQLARIERPDEDWEESVDRTNWSPTQNRLFNAFVNLLNSDHLARLAYSDTHNEPVARRVTVDKSVERVRRLLATVSWDPKFTQWLHQVLIDHLSTQYLACYLDILQTLRSKLPSFVDKMMTAANSTRSSLLTYETLFPLLKRPWDPVALSLMQDKPKKLPGNPVIVVVPSTPISSKRMLKWINLLSNLATVITIPSNYGGPANKTAMTNCVDQMFVMSRNKIQDIRLDYPGRNIVLVGFGFGATLALQLAQVEQVLCVISIGFSLVTADGRRGEPDDNLLELQCPVLFVIGQRSSTSLQEDMEDLRERMRVETGLIVVGSADDNLRVNNKKKKSEGITQSVVDRCVADEIGEFISGVILSPYPPQLRQSPTNLTTDFSKKSKERKRYNSTTSSIDSEPPSPTARITRPGQNHSPTFGRPPGSKTKTKLESRWSAQGISSPNTSPSHPSTLNTPDTSSSNDSNLTNDPPVKKLKTLKPTSNQQSQQTVKPMAIQNRSLHGLLQGELQTIIHQPPKSGASGIKVLENFKLSNAVNPKLFGSKLLDMSKMSVINPKGNANSLVLLPDGKLKNLGVKVPGSNRYITSKRQLVGNRPPKPAKKITYLPQTLAPPTNLTTQDIMDLPIIFADDNQILDSSLEMKPQVTPPVPKLITNNKFMVLNKAQNFIISPKVPAAQPKYTKIILSSKKAPPEHTVTTSEVVKKLPPDVSVRKIESEPLDLENEIAASTLYKRTSQNERILDDIEMNMAELHGEEVALKRTASEAEMEESASKIVKSDV